MDVREMNGIGGFGQYERYPAPQERGGEERSPFGVLVDGREAESALERLHAHFPDASIELTPMPSVFAEREARMKGIASRGVSCHITVEWATLSHMANNAVFEEFVTVNLRVEFRARYAERECAVHGAIVRPDGSIKGWHASCPPSGVAAGRDSTEEAADLLPSPLGAGPIFLDKGLIDAAEQAVRSKEAERKIRAYERSSRLF